MQEELWPKCTVCVCKRYPCALQSFLVGGCASLTIILQFIGISNDWYTTVISAVIFRVLVSFFSSLLQEFQELVLLLLRIAYSSSNCKVYIIQLRFVLVAVSFVLVKQSSKNAERNRKMIQDELEALFFDYLQVGYWISVWHFVNV